MVLPEANAEALFNSVKLNRSAASSTFLRVAGATLSTPRKARDTVACDTPASLATSAIVARAIPSPPTIVHRFHDNETLDFIGKHAIYVLYCIQKM